METVRTDVPVILDRKQITLDIAKFWNKTTKGFRMAWGPHIHHGYYDNHHELPVEAQENLIKKLTDLIKFRPGDKVLDAGCGMGGSSIYLAKHFHANVIGISLSKTQITMARKAAQQENIEGVSFKIEDALSLDSFAENTFEVVWSLESCEQFFDKELFLKNAFRILKPGGLLMLATWCSSEEEYNGENAKKYKNLCTSLQLPYMPTIKHYLKILKLNGFTVMKALDWTTNVSATWKRGLENITAISFLKILFFSGWTGLLFLKNANQMKLGFDEHRVEYGVIISQKPLPHN